MPVAGTPACQRRAAGHPHGVNRVVRAPGSIGHRTPGAAPSTRRLGRSGDPLMNKATRIIAIITIVAGAIMIVAGGATYYLVHRELADEKIVVSDDAENFAGDEVEGPLTAYSQAMVIKTHALDIADGLTYAQLPQDDPRRDTVMTASFLRTSLFTSVVAFGVAVLVVGLGVLFVILGIALIQLDRRTARAEAPTPAPDEPPPPSPPPPGDSDDTTIVAEPADSGSSA
jgi:hypothetical protein